VKIINDKAKFDYEISDRLEAGIALTGAEVKSARLGQVKLAGAFVRFKDGEMWVTNLQIYPYKYADNTEYIADRPRKILIKKKEMLALETAMKAGRLTLVPTAMYTKGPRVKLEIGLARGKKKYEKREAIGKRDVERDIEREMRGKGD
jgi:SsrA-binding protein